MADVVARGFKFGQIPHAITTDTEVTNAAYRVYGYLLMRARNESGRSWPGHRLIATETGMSRSTVKAGLKCLEETKWVSIERPDSTTPRVVEGGARVHSQVHQYVVHGSRPDRLGLEFETENRSENRTGLKTEPVRKSDRNRSENQTATGLKIRPELDQELHEELEPVADTSAIRPRDLLWETLVEVHGEPATKSERGKLNRARKQLAEADVDHVEYPQLVAAYMAKFSKPSSPAPQPTAMTIVTRVGELRHFIRRGPIAAPVGGLEDLQRTRSLDDQQAALAAKHGEAS